MAVSELRRDGIHDENQASFVPVVVVINSTQAENRTKDYRMNRVYCTHDYELVQTSQPRLKLMSQGRIHR